MWFLVWICLGFVAGVLALLLAEIWWFLTPGQSYDMASSVPMQFGAQFLPFRIPYELKQLLLSPGCEDKLKKKETCVCLNLFVQFLYQEFRESKWFRKWIVKRLQMEFNELLSRTAVSKFLQDVKIRNFSAGTQFPVIKDIQVNRVTLAPDKDSFQDLDLTMDVEYRGGFEVAIDVVALLGRCGSLSVRVTRLSGQARLQMTRMPYSHWSFSFLHEPIMEFKVDSEFRGRPLPQLVPLIINQFRRTVRKKHVLPAYKVRYRPFFVNPFLQPSADPSEYNHIEPKGVVRVTVVCCTRLNVAALVPQNKLHSGEMYCRLSTASRPLNFGMQRRDDSSVGQKTGFGPDAGSESYVSIALRYVRHSSHESFGLTVGKEYVPEKVSKVTVVTAVADGSAADRAGFKKGDLIIAVNSVGITTERQAAKLMSNTLGDIVVLVERKLANIDNEDDVSEQITSALGNQSNPNLKIDFNTSDEFFHISYNDEDDTKSLYQQSEERDSEFPLPRSHSDNDLSELGNNSLGYLRQADASAQAEEDGTGDGDRPDLRKNQSASVLIPGKKLAPSSESGGSYSPSTSSIATEQAQDKKNGDDQDQDSCSSASPPLSRKQRIAARATEKVAQVAHKWTTGKATVKDMWDRRQQRRKQGDESAPSSQVSSDTVISSLTNSKSEEAELKCKVNDAASVSSSLLCPDPASKQRNRSHSEPDTTIVCSVINASDKARNQVDKREKEETKSETSESSSKKMETASTASSPHQLQPSTGESKKSVTSLLFQSETKPVPYGSGEPVWYQNFPVPLDERSRYLNVVVYWRDSSAKPIDTDGRAAEAAGCVHVGERAQKPSAGSKAAAKDVANEPVPLGYATVFIPEALDDCSITKSLCHQQTYALRPPSLAVKLLPALEKMMLHPGFDPRLCYGDVTLGFQWLPDYEPVEEVGENEETGQQAAGEFGKRQDKQTADADVRRSGGKKVETTPEYIMSDGHKWLSTHFQHSIVCHICHKKIWLKSAYKCVQCDTVSHKKCIARAGNTIGQCGHVHETVAFESITVTSNDKPTAGEETGDDVGDQIDNHDVNSITELAADAVACIPTITEAESEQDKSLSSAGHSADSGKRLAFSERLAGLRRRRPKVQSALANMTAAHTAVPTSLESLSDVKWGSNDDNSPFHSLLYTKGGTYNEHMIMAAKHLGKDLYTSLPVDERKAKINEQIDRLQMEIDETTEHRLELLKKQGAKGDKSQMAVDLAKLDDKLQALAILMLHYCAGLQCCLDLEDNAAGNQDESGLGQVDHHDEEEIVERSLGSAQDGSSTGQTVNEIDDNMAAGLRDSVKEEGGNAESMFSMDSEEEKVTHGPGGN